ncbi:MAG: hypothetical protein LCH84_18125 [Gemmatimonadetes bacterium]|nr:hypothetical protein [Gemmatimonadota bacterium]
MSLAAEALRSLAGTRGRSLPVAAKLLLLYVAHYVFDRDEPRTIKVGGTADALNVKQRTARNNLKQLAASGFLTVVTAPTAGTAGIYRPGPRWVRAIRAPSGVPAQAPPCAPSCTRDAAPPPSTPPPTG